MYVNARYYVLLGGDLYIVIGRFVFRRDVFYYRNNVRRQYRLTLYIYIQYICVCVYVHARECECV